MSGKEFPVTLSIRAVDKGALARLRAWAASMRKIDTEKIKNAGSVLSGFSKRVGLPKLVEGFTGFGGAVKNVAGEALSLGARLLALGSVAGVALFSIVHGAVEAGDKLAELSARTGVAANWIASMRFAAAQLGDVDTDAFNSGMERFVKSLGDMKAGGGPLLEFLKKVSPKLGEQVKNAKNTSDAFGLMTDAFRRLDDPQKRAALGAAAFGRASGPGMAEFMHQGRGAILDQVSEFFRLSGSQEEFAQGASDLDNALRETETAFLGLRSAAAGALFPAFTMLAKAVTSFVLQNRDGLKRWAEGSAAAITTWVSGGGIDRLVSGLRDVFGVVRNVWETLGGFKGALVAAGVVMGGPLLSALAALVPAVYGLGVALLTTPVGWFVGAIGLIAGAAFLIVRNWEPVKKLFTDLFPKQAKSIADTIQGLKDLIALYQRFRKWSDTPVMNSDGKPLGESVRKPLPSWIHAPDPNAKQATWGGMWDQFQAFQAKPLFADAAGNPTGLSRNVPAPVQRVAVDFSNVPPGTVIRPDRRNTQPVDLDIGLAMGP